MSDDLREKILHTEDIYNGKIVHLVVHDVELPDGEKSKREVVQHPGAVAMVPLEGDDVFLVRQYRTAADKTLLEIPAGTLEPGEPPEACAVRECEEEIGYRPNRIESLHGVYTAPGYTTEFIHLYLVTDLVEQQGVADADEFIEVVRLPLTEAVAMIERGDIVDGKSVSGLLRVARMRGV